MRKIITTILLIGCAACATIEAREPMSEEERARVSENQARAAAEAQRLQLERNLRFGPQRPF